MQVLLQWGSALFALVAAGLWLKSATIQTPESFEIYVVQTDRYVPSMMGAKYMGHGVSPC